MTELLTLTIDTSKVSGRLASGGESDWELASDPLHLETIRVFRDWLRRGAIYSPDHIEVMGKHLYRLIFPEGSGEVFFQKALNGATAEPLRIRLRFMIGRDPLTRELASLPWEYLYSPQTEGRAGFYFSTNVQLILARSLMLEAEEAAKAADTGPLRVLAVAAEPKQLPPTASAEILDAIGKLSDRVALQLDRNDAGTIEGILEMLNSSDEPYHVLHVIAHGRRNLATGKYEIGLVDQDNGEVWWRPEADFADHFTEMKHVPRLVLLHLCESNAREMAADFSRLGPALIRARVPAVVATQYPMPNEAAKRFVRTFYEELAKGETVASAVQKGRWTLKSRASDGGIWEWGTPVVYIRSLEGPLVIRPEVIADRTAASQAGDSG